MFTKFNAAAFAFALAALLYACADVPWNEPPVEHTPAEPEICDGGSGPVGESDAGLKPSWCGAPGAPGSLDAPCLPCAFAPPGEPWCSDASPCGVIGMAASACGWSTPVSDACIEVGAYSCNEGGRMVCCPDGPASKPQCVNGPQDCIDFGPCIAAACAVDGSCVYNIRAAGSACGAAGMCGNGICFQ